MTSSAHQDGIDALNRLEGMVKGTLAAAHRDWQTIRDVLDELERTADSAVEWMLEDKSTGIGGTDDD